MPNAKKLSEIAQQVKNCQRCPLYKNATNGVPCEGNPNAQILFIGEGPGYYEDQEGRPFVGRAGKLLTRSIESIGLKREEVFITNVVKHRPPENRDPTPGEIDACNVWLDKQIEILKPKLIVTLGRYSLGKFIPNRSISQIHGKVQNIEDQLILPMYHPAAALRNGNIMDLFEQDFKLITKIMDLSNNKIDEDNGEDEKNSNNGSQQLNFF